ncbi:MAG: type II toxin-antitoxin system RelE/ParE family toxin [Halanaerobiales bacterium]|nr:type II toxin-antitoxin system RelE/ParE family toxin [Halanaerobiales bacterium]
MYTVKYYAINHKSPVVEFIQQQSPKEQAKILREIDLLEEFGLFLGMPHIKKLKEYNDLWELRIKHSSNIFRIFFLNYQEGVFILLHGFQKKSNHTPQSEVNKALKILNKIK